MRAKSSFFGLAFIVLLSGVCQAESILPKSWTFPEEPTPDGIGCISCAAKSGDSAVERPFMRNGSSLQMNMDLATVSPVDNILLKVCLGSKKPFVPSAIYRIIPYGLKSSNKKSLTVVIGGAKIVFDTAIKDLTESKVFSAQFPEYSISMKDGNILFATDKETEYLFSGKGLDWKLFEIRNIFCHARNIKCEYNTDGLLSGISLPDGNKYTIEYKDKHPAKINDPSGYVTEIAWNKRDRIAGVTTILQPEHPFYVKDPAKAQLNTVRNIHAEYDNNDRIVSIVTSSGEKFSAEYIKNADLAKKTISNTTILTAPGEMRIYSSIILNCADDTKTIESGFVLKGEDGKDVFEANDVTLFRKQEDSYLKISKIINGSETKFAYDGNREKVSSETDALGRVTSFKYNKQGRIICEIFPDKSQKTYRHDEKGRLIEKVDEDGSITNFFYRDNRLKAINEAGILTSYEYDNQGRPKQTTIPDGTIYSFEWDNLSRLVSYTKPNGVKLKYTYAGPLNKIVEIKTISSDGKENYAKTYAYDPKGRLEKIIYSDSTYESFVYDCCDLTAKKDERNNVFRYIYDQAHRLIKVTFNKKTIWGATYDEYGRLVRKKSIRDGDEEREYSKMWNAGKAWYTNVIKNPNGKMVFIRDTNGWPIEITENDTGKILYKYNHAQKVTSVRGNIKPWRDFKYDKSGNLVEKIYYGFPFNSNPLLARKIVYEFDKSNRKTLIIHPDGSTDETVYKKNSSQIYYIRNGNKLTFYTYNDMGQHVSSSILSLKEFQDATSTDKQELIKSQITERFKYDTLGRLWIKADANGMPREIFIYNNGNINKIAYVVEAVSDKYGAVFSYQNGIKMFVKYSNLNHCMNGNI